mgnify:CR=1 FL=1
MPHQYTRKVTRIGEHSLGVILPAGWIRYHQIGCGDLVELVSDDDILIRPMKAEKTEETEEVVY